MLIDDYYIKVDLIPDSDPEAKPYRAIVMCFPVKGNTYNTGIVRRANSPEEAFKEALECWKLKGNTK
ncbi:hypothetical protein LDC_0854 [sediment metagenome]|uniref:Uncharacterized protein n=1 Tax=sediment metagenome TaxID=749907 RepID=D9PH55_9ZZZZ